MSGQVSYLDDAAANIEAEDDGPSKSSGPAQPKITFYVDIISPFGYLAYYMLRNSSTFSNVQITYVPILLGGLHKQCGNVAPILIANKKEWINKERDRWASIFKIPIRDTPPPNFPVSTVAAMRTLTALKAEGVDDEIFAKAIGVFWAALWNPQSDLLKDVKGRASDSEFDIKSPDTLKTLLASVPGLSSELAGTCITRTAEKDVKDRLVSNTNEAFGSGAFGMPWFQCTDSKGQTEGFWGFDHLGQVAGFLGLDEAADLGRSGRPLKALL